MKKLHFIVLGILVFCCLAVIYHMVQSKAGTSYIQQNNSEQSMKFSNPFKKQTLTEAVPAGQNPRATVSVDLLGKWKITSVSDFDIPSGIGQTFDPRGALDSISAANPDEDYLSLFFTEDGKVIIQSPCRIKRGYAESTEEGTFSFGFGSGHDRDGGMCSEDLMVSEREFMAKLDYITHFAINVDGQLTLASKPIVELEANGENPGFNTVIKAVKEN